MQASVDKPKREEAYKSSLLNFNEKVVVVAPTGQAIAIKTIVFIISLVLTFNKRKRMIIGIIKLCINKI